VAKVEALESRQLLAATAPGWEDVSRLSLSFAPDGTSVAGQTSSLQTKLSALGPTAVAADNSRCLPGLGREYPRQCWADE